MRSYLLFLQTLSFNMSAPFFNRKSCLNPLMIAISN